MNTYRVVALAWAVAGRGAELALVVLGMLFTFFLEDQERSLVILLWWVLVALCYLLIGGIRVRRTRFRPDGAPDAPGAGARPGRLRFSFLFSIVSSLTGLTTAFEVALSSSTTDLERALEGVGSLAMILSWLLLHTGYARRYADLFTRAGPDGNPLMGLRFPQRDSETHTVGTVLPRPSQIDFLYFAFSVGATFSTSDVQVVSQRMRWHVMTHAVLSFFFNTAVVAFAITVLRGR